MSESNWIKHLQGLAKLEKNIGKKVAFESSADMIKNLEEELATLKASLPKIKADAVLSIKSNVPQINDGFNGFYSYSDIKEYANKLKAGE